MERPNEGSFASVAGCGGVVRICGIEYSHRSEKVRSEKVIGGLVNFVLSYTKSFDNLFRWEGVAFWNLKGHLVKSAAMHVF
jgi:hypothetical protein